MRRTSKAVRRPDPAVWLWPQKLLALSSTKPLYAAIGVADTATPEEIHDAFVRYSKCCHPDLGGDPVVFDRVANAHRVLIDPERRRFYDETGMEPDKADPVSVEALALIRHIAEGVITRAIDGSVRPYMILDTIKDALNDDLLELHRKRRAGLARALKAGAVQKLFRAIVPEADAVAGLVAGTIADEIEAMATEAAANAKDILYVETALRMIVRMERKIK